MSEITIRPLAAADREAWLPLWHGYLSFYKATLPADLDDVTFERLTNGASPWAASSPSGTARRSA